MNKQKQLLLIVLLVLVSNSIQAFGDQWFAALRPGLQESGQAGALVTIIKDFMQHFSDLDYATSRQLIIQIPATKYELIYHWGFVGSGDLFSPLPQVKAQFRPIQGVADTASSTSFADLGKIMVENEIFKKSKQIPLVKWLDESEISPIKLLIIKILLLIKSNSLRDITTLKYELFRLLFRLSLVEDVKIFDPSKPFTAYIPESLRFALDELSPEISKILDETWANVVQSKEVVAGMQHQGDFAVLTTYVFNDKAFAQQCFQKLALESTPKVLEGLINQQGYSLVSNDDFLSFSKLSFPHEALNPASKLVGKNSYGALAIQMCSSLGLPEVVCNKIKENTSDSFSLLDDVHGKAWIICKGGSLDTVQTLKLFTAALLATFKEYIQARKKILTSTTSQALNYKIMLQQQELEHAKRMRFLNSSYGSASKNRIVQAIAEVEKQCSSDGNYAQMHTEQENNKKLVTLKNAYQKELNTLERLTVAAGNARGKAQEAANLTVARAKQKCADLQQEIAALEKAVSTKSTMQSSSCNSSVADISAETEKRKQEYQACLKNLRAMMRKDQTLDSATQEKIKENIVALEKKLQELSVVPLKNLASDTQALEKLMWKRNKIAQVYEVELTIMKDALVKEQSELQQITDITLRSAKLLEFSSLKNDWQAYISSLEQQVVQMKQENEKLVELSEKRAIALSPEAVKPVSSELSEEIKKLEYEVGYLINAGPSGWLHTLVHASHDVKVFMQDLQGDSLPEFKQVKEHFFDKLCFIAKNSEHVKENLLLYHYLVALMIPEFLRQFELCTQV